MGEREIVLVKRSLAFGEGRRQPIRPRRRIAKESRTDLPIGPSASRNVRRQGLMERADRHIVLFRRGRSVSLFLQLPLVGVHRGRGRQMPLRRGDQLHIHRRSGLIGSRNYTKNAAALRSLGRRRRGNSKAGDPNSILGIEVNRYGTLPTCWRSRMSNETTGGTTEKATGQPSRPAALRSFDLPCSSKWGC